MIRKYVWFNGRAKLVLVLLGSGILYSLAGGTWAHNSGTQDGFRNTTFTLTTSGNHYHQAEAPPSGSIESSVIDTWDGSQEDYIFITNGACLRNVWTPGSPQLQYSLNSTWDFNAPGGTAEAWACNIGNALLPTCVIDGPGGE